MSDIYDLAHAMETEALEVIIDGKKIFIGRKGSSFREAKLNELHQANRQARANASITNGNASCN